MNSDRPTGRGDLPGDRPTPPAGERTLRDDLREARLRDRMADDDTLARGDGEGLAPTGLEGTGPYGSSQPMGGGPLGANLMGDDSAREDMLERTERHDMLRDDRGLARGGLAGDVPGVAAGDDGMLAPDLRARPREDRLGDRADDLSGTAASDDAALQRDDAHRMSEGAKDMLTSHPVGTALGAVGGAVTVGAAIGTIAGPIGTAVGAALGAAAGALAGKGIADMADPQGESEFWRTNWQTRDYADASLDYDQDYSPAYRYGVDAYSRYPERHYDDMETDLSAGWDAARGGSRLEWDRAKHASRDAWHRVKDAAERAMPGDADGDGR